MSKGFKRKKDMDWGKEKTVPISARVRESTKKILEKEADDESLSKLIGKILEDYAQWIRDGGK